MQMLALPILIGIGACLALARQRVVVGLVALTALAPISFDLTVLNRYDPAIVFTFAAGSIALLSPALFPRSRNSGSKRAQATAGWIAATTGVAVVAIVGTSIHFALGGVPLLSQNVEIARFDFTSSGFFGLPGRIYLMGIPLALAVCLRAEAVTGRGAFSSWQSLAVLALYCISRILSGFKSGLLEVLLVTTIDYIAAGHSVRLRHASLITVALLAALAFGFLVGTSYQTYVERGFVAAVLDRITVQASDPPAVVLADSNFHALATDSIETDFWYFTSRYFNVGGPPQYSFSQIISSRVTSTPLSPDSYLVPVTTTGVAEQIYDFGVPIGLITLTLTGLLLNRAEGWAAVTSGPYGFLLAIGVVLGGFEYATKGGLVYAIYNWGLVCAFLIAVVFASRTFASATSNVAPARNTNLTTAA